MRCNECIFLDYREMSAFDHLMHCEENVGAKSAQFAALQREKLANERNQVRRRVLFSVISRGMYNFLGENASVINVRGSVKIIKNRKWQGSSQPSSCGGSFLSNGSGVALNVQFNDGALHPFSMCVMYRSLVIYFTSGRSLQFNSRIRFLFLLMLSFIHRSVSQ